jgi:hypothetical protein
MNTEIESLFYQAEAEYLQQKDLELWQKNISSVQERLATYEVLREKEIEIFQPLVNQLLDTFPHEDKQKIERVLKHWISVLRYCSMAMLMNNSAYLQHRLLEWISPQVSAYQIQSLENELFAMLHKQLKKKLSLQEFKCLQPFLEQAQQTLVKENTNEISI